MCLKKSSFNQEDVCLLLSDFTGRVPCLPSEEREKIMQTSGYAEVLPIEKLPTDRALKLFRSLLDATSESVAQLVATVSRSVLKQKEKNKSNEIVLVSLARAGIPTGVLIKRYLCSICDLPIYHYGVSIMKPDGLDRCAMDFILSKHDPSTIQFVDGWTGKGSIKDILEDSVKNWEGVSPDLAVLVDPTRLCDLAGTHDDVLIPTCCLNSTVCGLISRTVYKPSIMSPGEFHGVIVYDEFKDNDLTYEFIDKVTSKFSAISPATVKAPDKSSSYLYEIDSIAEQYGVTPSLVKPGIGESTRVLLRRVPKVLLLRSLDDPKCSFVLELAREKGIPVETFSSNYYSAAAVIQKVT